MKNVRQKFNSCRRAVVLLTLAILLSLLPFGKALADSAVVEQDDAVVTITFNTTGPQGNLPANYMPATITGLDIVVKEGHTLTSFTFPVEVKQRDDQKFWSFTKYDISSGTGLSGITDVIVPENVVEIASLPSFPDATHLSLPATLTSMSPKDVLTKIGQYSSTSLTIASANETYSQEDGILYNKDFTRLLFVHQNLTSGSSTFMIRASVTGLGKDDTSSTWDEVFQDKTGITTLEIPATCLLGANTQYESLYKNWTELLNINIYGNNPDHSTYQYYSVDGVVCKYDDGGNILVYYPQERTATIYKVPDGVKEVQKYGFYKSKFTSIELNQVEKLAESSFFKCTNNIDLTIGESLAEIPANSFNETKIKSYDVVEENQYFASDNAGVLFNKGMTKLMEYPQGADVRVGYEVPATVTEIGEKAFSNCKTLSGAITFAGTALTTIGDYAFNQCDLTNIDLSGQTGITEIPKYCFSQSELSSILPPPNLTTIGEYAFHGTKLSGTLSLPSGVTSIGQDAFSYCRNLTGVTFPASLSYIGENAFGTCPNLNETNTILPTTVTTLGAGAFSYCGFTEVTIPEVENYGGGAFMNNANLVKAIIRPGMTIIPEREFDGCSKLASITIPNSITEISRGVFSGTALTEVTIPASVTKIGYNNCAKHSKGAFQGCTKLKKIIFEDRSDAEPLEILDYTFQGCTSLTEVTIPAGVSKIGCYAFQGCTKLTSVTLNGVTEIGHWCFTKCGELSTLSLPETLTTIRKSAFACCNKLNVVNLPASLETMEQNVFLNCRGLETVNVADGSKLKSIPGYAFCWTTSANTDACNSNSVVIDNDKLKNFNFLGSSSLTNIGNSSVSSSFYKCVELESFKCPSTLKNIYSYSFYGCKNLTTLTFKDDGQLARIYTKAFMDCENLGSVNFPSTLQTINSSAFQNCVNLEKITFGDNGQLKTIDKNAFQNCRKLKNITFPSTLQTIGAQAFTDCTSLTEVNFPALIQKIDGQAFEFCPNIEEFNVAELKIPEGSTEEEATALRKKRQYSSVGGYLMYADKTTLVGFPEAKANDRFTLLPPSITRIGPYAFFSCEKLKNVVIPNKVTSIGDRAFGQCKNLKTITFLCDEVIKPDSITQKKNLNSFDDKFVDVDGAKDDGFTGMTFYVRADLLKTDALTGYQDYEYYWPDDVNKRPKLIPSFKADTREFHSWESDKASVEQNEYINVSETEVDFLNTTSTDHTFVLPEKVKKDGKSYDVGLIGDYAFENASGDIKEVVVLNNINYIGGNAFVTKRAANKTEKNESTIKRVFFVTNAPENGTPDENVTALEKLKKEQLSTTRFKLTEEYTTGEKDYREFTTEQQIFVKKSMCDGYKDSWPLYTSQIDYKIKPGAYDTTTSDLYDFVKVSSGKKYSTFSREFDVDLGEYAAEEAAEKGEDAGSFDIKAFTIGVLRGGAGREQDYPEGSGDKPSNTYTADYHLRMYHIGYENDLGSDKPEYKKGTYIPNSTGALLAVMNDWNGTPGDYFYCIGEDDKGGARNTDAYIDEDGYVNGSLHHAVESTTVLPAIEPDDEGVYHPTQWVLQQGAFKPVKSKTVNLPPHKSWLYLDMSPMEEQQGAASAPMMTFGFCLDDSSVATDIETAAEKEGRHTEAEGIYTITGVKVLRPETKGIYIINGKKHVIR